MLQNATCAENKKARYNAIVDKKESTGAEGGNLKKNATVGAAITFEKKIRSAEGGWGTIDVPGIGQIPEGSLDPEKAAELGCDLSTARDLAGQPLFNKQELQSLKLKETPESRCLALAADNLNMKSAISFVNQTSNPKTFLPIGMKEVGGSVNCKGEEVFVAQTLGPGKYKLNGAEADDGGKLAVEICDWLQGTYQLRLFKRGVYCFHSLKGYYKLMKEYELDFLINQQFGKRIKACSNPGIYGIDRSLLSKEAHLAIPEDYELSGTLYVFRDRILNAETLGSLPNDGRIFVTHALAADYRPGEECPNFDAFLRNLTNGDDEEIELIWQTLGYLFSSDLSAKVFFVFVGPKDTGKSLLANLITKIVGEEGTKHLGLADFGGRFDMAELCGAHLNACMDLPVTPLSETAVGKIKSYTGNDGIRSDVKNKAAISFKPTAHLLFGSNSPISTVVRDRAFEERMIEIPFVNPVPKEKQNPHLLEILFAEKEGICQKALVAYRKLVQNRYRFVELPRMENKVTLNIEKLFADFIQRNLEVTGSPDDYISVNQAYVMFKGFCASIPLTFSLSEGKFSQKLRDMLGDRCGKAKKRCNGKPNPVSVITGIKCRKE